MLLNKMPELYIQNNKRQKVDKIPKKSCSKIWKFADFFVSLHSIFAA